MNIAISVEMTPQRRLKNSRLQMHWFGWLLRLVGVGYLIWWATDAHGGSLLVLGVAYLVLPELIGLIAMMRGQRFGPVYTYTLTEEAIGIRTAITNLEFDWTAVKSIREHRGDWYLRVTACGAFTLPKESFTPEQAAEWREFVAARRLVAA